MTKENKKYNGWLWALKLCAVRFFEFTPETKFDPKSWRVYFDNGYTVLEALREDFKYL